MAAALSHGKQVFEYAPTRIKQAITGRGSAPKEQVAALLKSMLGVDYATKRLDATDGMAVALCHHFASSSPIAGTATTLRKSRKASTSWESFVAAHPDREIRQKKK